MVRKQSYVCTWALIMCGLLWLYFYSYHEFYIKSEKKELLASESNPEDSGYRQNPPLFRQPPCSIADLEFRYAWYKINQVVGLFQPFSYLIEPAVCAGIHAKEFCVN
ncbi:unnamed protein product [Gongylonema pulchrum]|uniref:CMP-N-acetylneuraminate-beta-1,4-galactoside alpha-2,3-sialyltransferase n=1 Tax=Gongylonema pulchrum TaxID=637853 RepID=A0A183DJ81_9BILA|nr:unnamed protein product [Gongylonema pulchrum]